MHLIRRRIVLLAMIAAAALAVPRPGGAADAASLPRIAFLSGDLTCAANPGFGALLDELRSLGYRDGETVSIHCRSAGSSYQRLDALASELVQLKPVVLVAAAAPASLAAKRATRNTPIISVYTADPVALGLVANLARPDGNVTGISALASDYVAKSLQLLREAAPGTSRVGVLGHIANSTYPLYQRELAAAAQTMGLAIDFAGVESVQQIDTALSDLRRRGADAFLIMHQPL